VVPWFAVWTRSRHERVVRDQLAGLGFEVFLPTVMRWRRWNDRRKQVEFALFPGYCFARFLRSDRLPVLKCSGVVDVVSFNGEIAPIPEHEIESIRTLLASQLPFDPCPLIPEGALVRVAHGPLRGAIGRIERKGPRTNLVLSIDILNRAVSVTVDAADIEPL